MQNHSWNLDLPQRTIKKREKGITSISDKGLGLNALMDIIDICGDYIDIAKFSIGSAVVTGKLKEKIAIYKKNNIDVYLGGSTFEKYYDQGKLEDYKRTLNTFGVSTIEISDGIVDIPLETKVKTIRDFCNYFRVIAEVGCKDRDFVYSPDEWVTQLKECLNAGAWKVLCEGRESGDAGIYQDDSTPREDTVNRIINEISLEQIIWETPKAQNQIYFINRFGANVNLGNISPHEVLILESQRVGLRYDTF